MSALQGFDWTTPFIVDACAQLSLPVRVGPFGLRCNFPGSKVAGPARPARHAGSVDVFLGAIHAIGARVWSLGTCPNGPLELRKRSETALVAATIGSVTVTPDDYLFADDDGVVVVANADLSR